MWVKFTENRSHGQFSPSGTTTTCNGMSFKIFHKHDDICPANIIRIHCNKIICWFIQQLLLLKNTFQTRQGNLGCNQCVPTTWHKHKTREVTVINPITNISCLQTARARKVWYTCVDRSCVTQGFVLFVWWFICFNNTMHWSCSLLTLWSLLETEHGTCAAGAVRVWQWHPNLCRYGGITLSPP